MKHPIYHPDDVPVNLPPAQSAEVTTRVGLIKPTATPAAEAEIGIQGCQTWPVLQAFT
ncbi:hypothetical protein [Prosthecobacter sp.]|uniref:hypothetical protein n=1 Tax=Prosthecobacter sp. TaxID=1965333 RepID=UPI00378334C9